MTNKLRRSMTSVLLAASLLFSSQSVIAFADYGSKSDASDLSPVQESVENATEEQQEEPSLSVEPVIGESTEAPVAAPMMARANAPVTYSAPEVSGYEEYLYYDYSHEDSPDTIAIYQTSGSNGKIDEYYSDPDAFAQTRDYYSYTVDVENFEQNGWVFKNWTYSLKDGNQTELGNRRDYALRYTFSDGGDDILSWYRSYQSGNSISINAIDKDGAEGVWAKDILHHSIYANFNPLVTVNYNKEQGSVTADKPHGNNKFEAEYAQDKVFTITTSSAYKPYVNNTECTLTNSDVENDIYTYTYTLPSVTDPTTLNVEFEKAEDVITADDIDGYVIINVLCPNGHSHSFNMSEGTAGRQGDYYIMSFNPSKAKVSINSKAWVKKFNELTGMVQHELTGDSYITFELTRDDPDEKWKLPDEAKQYKVIIDVKCTSEIPEPSTPDVTDLDNLFLEGVTVKCSEKDNHTKSYHFKDIDADNYNNAFYTVTKPELQDGGKYLSILTVKNQAYVNRYNMSTFPEEPHKLNDKNEQTFKLVWDGIKWSCEESTSIGISVTCGIPDPKPSDLAGVQVKLECVNDATHNQTIGFDWLSSEDYYTVTRDEKDPIKATVSISEQQSINWVNNSNTVGKPQHVLYSAANNSISLTYKDEKWELDYPNNVFCIKVLCPPTDLIMDKLNVSVQCAEKADHELQTFDMIADTFTATVKQNTDNEYVCELTVNSEKYVELYNSRHPGHVPAAPATVVPLKYTGSAWEVIVGKETIPFVVSCEAPDAPTTDEVSIMGKLLTLDCITENVNHSDVSYNLDRGTFTVGEVYTQNTIMPLSDNTTVPAATYHVNVTVNRTSYYLNQYNNVYGTHTLAAGNPVEPIVVLEYNGTEWTPINNARLEVEHEVTTPGGGGEGTNPGGNGGDNDDDDDRYTGGNTVTRTINDDDVPLNDRPNNTTTIDDEDVPLADLPDDTVTIDDGEVPLKANPSTGDSLPFAAMAAAALSLGGVIVLNRKKK